MSFQTALRSRLIAVPAIAAALTEIEWGSRTENGRFPALVLHEIMPGRSYTMQGNCALHGAAVQADFWAESYRAATEAFDLVLAELERPRVTSGGILFDACFLTGGATSTENVPGLALIHRRRAQFNIWWKPAF